VWCDNDAVLAVSRGREEKVIVDEPYEPLDDDDDDDDDGDDGDGLVVDNHSRPPTAHQVHHLDL